VMTTAEAAFKVRRLSGVSHLGGRARASPELYVVSSLPMSARVCEVGIPCTSNCAVGLSSWTVVVPGMRWRNCDTLLLSEDAFTVSMVIRVKSLLGQHTMRYIRVAWRAEFMLSL